MRYLLFYLMLLIPRMILAQSASTNNSKFKSDKDTAIKLDRPQWNRVINGAFLTILGAKSDNAAIGSYASLDPAAGSFTFKGSIPIGTVDSTRISYLSITANGDLISDSYAALFANSKLNTNAGIQAQWHVRLGANRFTVSKAHIGQYTFENGLLKRRLMEEVEKSIAVTEHDPQDSLLLSYQVQNLDAQVSRTQLLSSAVQRIVDSLFRLDGDLAEKKKWTDSLAQVRSNLNKLRADRGALSFKMDSLHLVIRDAANYSYYLDRKAYEAFEARQQKLDTVLSLKKIEFCWFTVSLGGGKKKFYTHQEGVPFADQITKRILTTWKIGITWNYFNQSRLSDRAYYLNVGISRSEDNNTALLSTQEVVQERVVKSAAGDTTRKITQKYNVYTDPIESMPQWSLFGNFYYLFGKRTSGFHFFPSFQLPDGGKSTINVGVGYIVSFLNNKKDQPVINAEGYVQFNDINNNMELGNTFWNRNEIGIRFSLPFALLEK